MAFADWLLPLLLLPSDDEHGRVLFDWLSPAVPRPVTPPVLLVVPPAV